MDLAIPVSRETFSVKHVVGSNISADQGSISFVVDSTSHVGPVGRSPKVNTPTIFVDVSEILISENVV